jgi:hypothetical protein
MWHNAFLTLTVAASHSSCSAVQSQKPISDALHGTVSLSYDVLQARCIKLILYLQYCPFIKGLSSYNPILLGAGG